MLEQLRKRRSPRQASPATRNERKTIGPLLVIAGAGSGKTKTLAHRVAHLVINGADPHRILLLTFTRRAANEMKSRARRVVSGAVTGQKIDLPWAGTFHAVGALLKPSSVFRIARTRPTC